MQIVIRSKDVVLSDRDHGYIERKLGNLKKFSGKVSDESSIVHVDVERPVDPALRGKNGIGIRAQIHLPADSFYVDVTGATVTEAVDGIFEKAQRHIEKYKAKTIRH
ncbi:MAG: HPF/RaiA family ribosome-associated protein [Patescibacteria group bacterium]